MAGKGERGGGRERSTMPCNSTFAKLQPLEGAGLGIKLNACTSRDRCRNCTLPQ